MWIDSHCHLTHERIVDQGTPEELVARAHDNSVDGMLTINCRISDEFEEIYETAQKFKNVWCSVGTHPHDAGNEAEKAITKDKIVEISKDSKVVGIGESGLDYHYDNSPRDDQQASFRKHIRACLDTGLPLIIHARDADNDIEQIMKEEAGDNNEKGLNGVMHCFSSGPDLAEFAIEFGFYISFSGIVTFKKAEELRDISKTVPSDKILVETDAPFLAPMPYRGKTNEPAFVRHTGEFLADFLDVPADQFARQTSDNFYRLFKKANGSL